MNTPETTTPVRLNAMTAIAAFACVVSIVGALLPWGELTIPVAPDLTTSILVDVGGDLAIPGTDTADGKLVVGLAFAALVVIVAFRFTRRRWLSIVALLLGAVIAATGVADTVNAENNAPELARELRPVYFSVGAGLYVSILGGLALVASAAYLAVTARRGPRHSGPAEEDPG